MKFNDIFTNEVDYPQDGLMDGIKMDTWYDYVSMEYLNHFAKYGKPVFLITFEVDGYMWDQVQIGKNISVFTKEYHSNIAILGDNTILITEHDDSYLVYWFTPRDIYQSIGRVHKNTTNLSQLIDAIGKQFIKGGSQIVPISAADGLIYCDINERNSNE